MPVIFITFVYKHNLLNWYHTSSEKKNQKTEMDNIENVGVTTCDIQKDKTFLWWQKMLFCEFVKKRKIPKYKNVFKTFT